jgi:hypothetical protein
MKLAPLAILLALPLAAHGATIYAIDINDAGNSVTASGWTGLDANHTGNGGSVTVDGVTFSPFSADGARLRGTTTNPNPNALTGDFIFDDGGGQSVGLLFGGAGDLEAGPWQVEVWIYDPDFDTSGVYVGWRESGSETIVADNVAQSAIDPAITFTFTSDGVSSYDVFVRENNTGNRTRLNAVRLTLVPEPSSSGVLLVAMMGLSLLRRKRA